MTQSYPNVVNAWALALQSTSAPPDQFMVYGLADNSVDGAKRVEAELKAAEPGEFVAVEIRFANMVDTTTLHVQPHMWGAWCLVERTIPATEMFGRPT